MTSNQIAYFKAREDVRAHQASEMISRQANEISKVTAEANRRNAETNASNAEVNRQNAETNRYNAEIALMGQGIYYYATQVAERNAETNYLNALTNQRNADLRYEELLETERTHMFYEGEEYRHNLATELHAENQLAELERSNRATEALGWGKLAEETRSNKQSENLRGAQIYHDYELGKQQQTVNLINAETRYEEYEETRRHNVSAETLSVVNSAIGIISDWGRSLTSILRTSR